MLRNYLIVAVRNLLRHKLYSAINVVGLAVGIALCILIFLFVADEWSYDAFHQNGDRIYRVVTSRKLDDGRVSWSSGRATLGPLLRGSFPEIERMVRYGNARSRVTREEETFRESVTFVDPEVFEVFSFNLERGDPDQALRSDHSVVISKRIAQKYFGNGDPVGRALVIDSFRIKGEKLVVTGVVRELPQNSSITFDLMVPFSWIEKVDGGAWTDVSGTYILTAKDTDAGLLAEKCSAVRREHPPAGAEWVETTQVHLEQLADLHYSSMPVGAGPAHNQMYPYILSAIAISVLLIACINFMTLSIGHASARCREIGMRKVLGAMRGQLMNQFWAEAILLSFLALVLGMVLAGYFLPIFNDLVDKRFSSADVYKGHTQAVLVMLALSTGSSIALSRRFATIIASLPVSYIYDTN